MDSGSISSMCNEEECDRRGEETCGKEKVGSAGHDRLDASAAPDLTGSAVPSSGTWRGRMCHPRVSDLVFG